MSTPPEAMACCNGQSCVSISIGSDIPCLGIIYVAVHIPQDNMNPAICRCAGGKHL